MFFFLSKVFTFLIDPVFLLFVFIVLLWFFSRINRRMRLLTFLIIIVAYVAATHSVSNQLMRFLENRIPPSSLAQHYDAVIVLSGMVDLDNSEGDDIEFQESVDRILTGISWIDRERADVLIISGGEGALRQQQRSEAEKLKNFALSWGIEESRVLIDPHSRNTYENAVNTAKLVKENQFKRLLLITSAFHMVRARGCFRKAGLEPDVQPVDYRSRPHVSDFRGYLPHSDALAQTRLFIHEVVGIFVYRLTGRAHYS